MFIYNRETESVIVDDIFKVFDGESFKLDESFTI